MLAVTGFLRKLFRTTPKFIGFFFQNLLDISVLGLLYLFIIVNERTSTEAMTRVQRHNPNSKSMVRDAEATRASILDAAELEFSKVGLLGARTEAISARTGVTKAMIHYYFENKENLYRAVIERAIQRRAQEMSQVQFEQMAPIEALKTFFDGAMDSMKANPSVASILLFEALQNAGRFYHDSSVACLYRPVIAILERGMADGSFRKMDPMHAAINLVGMCSFYVTTRDNLRNLWDNSQGEVDLMSDEMYNKHRKCAMEMIMNAVCA
jgi:TetR/AcrR family transcriptional regulator